MEENLSFKDCSAEDVISSKNTTFKLETIIASIKTIFPKHQLGERITNSLNSKSPIGDLELEARKDNGDVYIAHKKWFDEGIDCEILKLGAKSWQKGKVKINIQVSLEFCPDESENQQLESPLDDLRLIIEKSHN